MRHLQTYKCFACVKLTLFVFWRAEWTIDMLIKVYSKLPYNTEVDVHILYNNGRLVAFEEFVETVTVGY